MVFDKLLRLYTTLFYFLVGCSEIDNLFKINSSAFSQAPGTELEIILSCHTEDKLITVMCTDDGNWIPNPDSSLCLAGK